MCSCHRCALRSLSAPDTTTELTPMSPSCNRSTAYCTRANSRGLLINVAVGASAPGSAALQRAVIGEPTHAVVAVAEQGRPNAVRRGCLQRDVSAIGNGHVHYLLGCVPAHCPVGAQDSKTGSQTYSGIQSSEASSHSISLAGHNLRFLLHHASLARIYGRSTPVHCMV